MSDWGDEEATEGVGGKGFGSNNKDNYTSANDEYQNNDDNGNGGYNNKRNGGGGGGFGGGGRGRGGNRGGGRSYGNRNDNDNNDEGDNENGESNAQDSAAVDIYMNPVYELVRKHQSLSPFDNIKNIPELFKAADGQLLQKFVFLKYIVEIYENLIQNELDKDESVKTAAKGTTKKFPEAQPAAVGQVPDGEEDYVSTENVQFHVTSSPQIVEQGQDYQQNQSLSIEFDAKANVQIGDLLISPPNLSTSLYTADLFESFAFKNDEPQAQYSPVDLPLIQQQIQEQDHVPVTRAYSLRQRQTVISTPAREREAPRLYCTEEEYRNSYPLPNIKLSAIAPLRKVNSNLRTSNLNHFRMNDSLIYREFLKPRESTPYHQHQPPSPLVAGIDNSPSSINPVRSGAVPAASPSLNIPQVSQAEQDEGLRPINDELNRNDSSHLLGFHLIPPVDENSGEHKRVDGIQEDSIGELGEPPLSLLSQIDSGLLMPPPPTLQPSISGTTGTAASTQLSSLITPDLGIQTKVVESGIGTGAIDPMPSVEANAFRTDLEQKTKMSQSFASTPLSLDFKAFTHRTLQLNAEKGGEGAVITSSQLSPVEDEFDTVGVPPGEIFGESVLVEEASQPQETAVDAVTTDYRKDWYEVLRQRETGLCYKNTSNPPIARKHRRKKATPRQLVTEEREPQGAAGVDPNIDNNCISLQQILEGYNRGERRGGFGRGRGRGGGRGGRDGDRDGDRNGRDGDRGGRREYNNNKGDGDEEGGDDNANGEPQKPREFYIPPEPTDNEDEIFGTGITSGINFAKYDSIPVKVTGENAPPAIQTFEEAALRDIVLNNIKRSGYTIPTPIQKTAIPVIAAGRDLMACAQTGSGKTASFLLPIINKLLSEGAETSIGKPHAIVVSPTRELAIQIFNEARKFAMDSYLNIRIVYGGTSSKHQGENMNKGGSHILIATPGRLLDFVEKGFISFEDIRFVVLDEADRMLDMGFKESVATIMNHPTMRAQAERQNLMFSATFPAEIQRMAGEYLNEYIFIAIGVVGGACSDVTQNVYEVKKFQKRAKLMELLQENPDGTIVFVETKRGADFLASLLSETEFPTTSIHGDRLQRQRETALADFKSGAMKVLIATSVAARGLDIKNVNHVVNYDMPSSIDEYVHRIGRTGRVGNNGRATSFFDPDNDTGTAADLVKILEGAGQEVPDFLKNYSSGSGGGGDDFGGSRFGGRDVRKGVSQTNDDFASASGPIALEADEDWS